MIETARRKLEESCETVIIIRSSNFTEIASIYAYFVSDDFQNELSNELGYAVTTCSVAEVQYQGSQSHFFDKTKFGSKGQNGSVLTRTVTVKGNLGEKKM